MKIYLNGQIVDENEAKISVLDRGYLFGEGIFETLRSYNGALPFLDKHLKRMEWGSTFIGIPFPHPRQIGEAIQNVLAVNSLKNARIRIMLSFKNLSGFKALAPTSEMATHLVIGCEAFEPLPDCDYEKGVSLCVIRSVKNEPPPASNIKSLSRLTKMIARREVMEKEATDGILLDANGYVTEATTANIFWVKEGKLFTPPVDLGLLPGVTREVVLNLARENGIESAERSVKGDELLKTDEIFITGSTLEVMPVGRIDGTPIGQGRGGKMTRELQRLYKERIAEEMK